MRYLLDENLPERLARLLRARGLDAVHVRELDRGGLTDEAQLAFAAEQGRVFISRDYDDMPRLTRQFLQDGLPHAGVLLLPRSIANGDIGSSATAIISFAQDFGEVQPYQLSWLQSAPASRG